MDRKIAWTLAGGTTVNCGSAPADGTAFQETLAEFLATYRDWTTGLTLGQSSDSAEHGQAATNHLDREHLRPARRTRPVTC
jgi:hypothetical protein